MGGFFELLGDDGQDSVDSSVQEFLSEMDSPQAAESADDSEIDDRMEDVELRLEVASLYRSLLRDQLFEARTPATALVEKRMRAFAKADMKRLLGMEQPAPPKPKVELFSEQEVSILKSVAANVMAKVQQQPPTPIVVGLAPVVVPPPAPQPQGVKQKSAPARRLTEHAVKPRPAPTTNTLKRQPAPAGEVAPPAQPKAQKKAMPGIVSKPLEPGMVPLDSNQDGVVAKQRTENPTEEIVTSRVNGRLVKQYFRDGRLVNVNDRSKSTSKKSLPLPTQQQQAQLSVQSAAVHVDTMMRSGIG